MRRTLHVRFILLAIIGAFVLPTSGLPASAHETQAIGGYRIQVGWAEEPAFAGVKNAVALDLTDAAGKPVTGLGDELKVEVIFGDRKLGPLSFQPAGDGVYRASFIPTRPGNYTFHLVGSIKGQKVDQSFSPADKQGLEGVEDPGEVELPAKDPSRGELASRVDRLVPRLETAQTGSEAAGNRAGLAVKLGIAGIAIGMLALAFSAVAALRARPGPAGNAGAPASRKEQTRA